MSDFKYTVPVCNYNMGDTIERTLRSVLEQTNEDYEVLVVDGGSTDDSITTLRRIDREYENFRYISLGDPQSRTIGADRHLSVQESSGDYLLLHIDADDCYDDALPDLLDIFHQIESQTDRELVLVGSHITVISRDHLIALGSYRDLPAAEDIDLWRRAILDEDSLFIWLDCDPFWEHISDSKTTIEKLRRSVNMKVGEFQFGITLRSSVSWSLNESAGWKQVYGAVTSVLAYMISKRYERYDSYEGLTSKVALKSRILPDMDVTEIEAKYGIEVDLSRIREHSMKYFDPDSMKY